MVHEALQSYIGPFARIVILIHDPNPNLFACTALIHCVCVCVCVFNLCNAVCPYGYKTYHVTKETHNLFYKVFNVEKYRMLLSRFTMQRKTNIESPL